MALISPGIEVKVTDESNYLPTAVGSVPFVLVATAENKKVPGSNAIAAGTLKDNAGLVNVVTSQRELANLFGYPTFRTSTSGSPLHGDELNEYGLMAAYSALGVANRAFIIRADVDLNQLVSTSVRPKGEPESGAHWLDLSDTTWGLNVWDATIDGRGAPVSTPVTVLNSLSQVSGGVPLTSVGTTGDYAVVTTSTFNQIFYKAGPFVGANIAPHSWVVVGSDDWQNAVPTYFSNASVSATIVGGANLVINSTNVQLSSSATIAAVATAINSANITGVAARFNTISNLLELFATANSKSNGSTIDGKLKIHSVSDSPSSNAWVLANLNLSSGTYACPAVSFTTQAPEWKSFDTTPRPTDSVWVNTSKSLALNSANLNVKTYNTSTEAWAQIGAPLYADDFVALYNLDPIAGGIDIPKGTVYVKYNSYENGTTTVSGSDVVVTNGTVSFTPFIKTSEGVLKVTGDLPITPFTPGESFTVQASVPGSLSMSSIVTVTMTGTTAQTFVADFAANVGPVINDVVATVEDSGAISIRHLSGGMIRLKNVSGTPLGDAGFSVDVANMRLDVNENVLIASPFELLDYTPSDSEPFSNPESGTIWYYGTPTEVDVMVHDGSGWKGYRNVTLDARGYNLSLTDPNGVMFGTVEPTTQSDGSSALASGDLWIDTSDLENYPKLYRYDTTEGKWTLIDNTDRITEDGIVFADARWDTNGNTHPINDQLTTIAELAVSNWLDSDAPDYRLFARGTLLFNTRRSGYNVKKFVNNYWNLTAFPEDQDSGHEHTELDAWVSTSGSKENGEPLMGRKAVRDVVVRALQAAVDSSTAIREEQLDFNLMAAPGYTELVDNLSALNADRKGTAHIIGDTPMRLPANGTELTVWATGGTDKRLKFSGEDGFATVDNTISLYYPSGITNDLQGRTIAVPPSHMMLRTMIRNDQAAYAWFAPAGVRRGTIDNVSGIGYVDSATGGFVRVGINEGLRDILYTNNINPITILPGVGLLNFGNKTRAGVNSALDRVNVSRLISYIRRQLAQVANNYLFEPNDAITRNSIKLLVGGLLNDLIAKRGITDYLVVCDETNNTPDRVARNELYVDVAIEPTKTVEFIYIPIRIKNPGEIRSGNESSSNPV